MNVSIGASAGLACEIVAQHEAAIIAIAARDFAV